MKDIPDYSGPMCNWPHVQVLPGARKTLQTLTNQGVCCHLATNARDSSEQQIHQALVRAGLAEWISEVFCFSRLGVMKPAPEFFQGIASILSTELENLIMVGDNLNTDVQGAKQAGVRAIWLNTENQAVPQNVEAIYSLEQLWQTLEKTGTLFITDPNDEHRSESCLKKQPCAHVLMKT